MGGNPSHFRQGPISVICPTIYGPGSYPLVLLLLLYFVCLLLCVQQLIDSFRKTRLLKSLTKKAFLLLMTLFLFLRSLFIVSPFPYTNRIVFTIFTQQTPRYLFVLGWQFLAMWIGNAAANERLSQRAQRIIGITFIFLFTSIFVIMLVIMPIEDSNNRSDRHYDSLYPKFNIASYLLVLISMGGYGGYLIYILFQSSPSSPTGFLGKSLHWRVTLLCTMIIIMFVCFLIRFFWALFSIFSWNVIQTGMNKLYEKCRNDNTCAGYYWAHSVFYIVTEGVPPFTLLLVFILLSLQKTVTRNSQPTSISRDVRVEKGGSINAKAERRRKKKRKKTKGKKEKKRLAAGHSEGYDEKSRLTEREDGKPSDDGEDGGSEEDDGYQDGASSRNGQRGAEGYLPASLPQSLQTDSTFDSMHHPAYYNQTNAYHSFQEQRM